jgi:hypothetical protein
MCSLRTGEGFMRNSAVYELWVGLLVISFGMMWIGMGINILNYLRGEYNRFKKGLGPRRYTNSEIYSEFFQGKEIEKRMFKVGLLGFVVWCSVPVIIELVYG